MNKNEIQNLIKQQKNLSSIIEESIKNRLIETGNKKASELLNMEQSTISLFVHNKRKFSLKMLEKIIDKIF